MATSTVPQTYDSIDWHEGLVVLPADHVYGKTVLPRERWQARAEECDGQRFVVVYTSRVRKSRKASKPLSWDDARLGLAVIIAGLRFRSAVGPHGVAQLSVMSETEWERVRP